MLVSGSISAHAASAVICARAAASSCSSRSTLAARRILREPLERAVAGSDLAPLRRIGVDVDFRPILDLFDWRGRFFRFCILPHDSYSPSIAMTNRLGSGSILQKREDTMKRYG